MRTIENMPVRGLLLAALLAGSAAGTRAAEGEPVRIVVEAEDGDWPEPISAAGESVWYDLGPTMNTESTSPGPRRWSTSLAISRPN